LNPDLSGRHAAAVDTVWSLRPLLWQAVVNPVGPLFSRPVFFDKLNLALAQIFSHCIVARLWIFYFNAIIFIRDDVTFALERERGNCNLGRTAGRKRSQSERNARSS